MKTTIIAILASAALVVSAQAKDFTGLYLGAGVSHQFGTDAKTQTPFVIKKAKKKKPAVMGLRHGSKAVNSTSFVASGLGLYQFDNNIVVGAELGGEIGDNKFGGFAMARAGYAIGRFMPYVQGGVGVDQVDFKVHGFKVDKTQVNGRVGAGAMVALTERLSLDVNYTYVVGQDMTAPGIKVEGGRHAVMAMARFKF